MDESRHLPHHCGLHSLGFRTGNGTEGLRSHRRLPIDHWRLLHNDGKGVHKNVFFLVRLHEIRLLRRHGSVLLPGDAPVDANHAVVLLRASLLRLRTF